MGNEKLTPRVNKPSQPIRTPGAKEGQPSVPGAFGGRLKAFTEPFPASPKTSGWAAIRKLAVVDEKVVTFTHSKTGRPVSYTSVVVRG